MNTHDTKKAKIVSYTVSHFKGADRGQTQRSQLKIKEKYYRIIITSSVTQKYLTDHNPDI